MKISPRLTSQNIQAKQQSSQQQNLYDNLNAGISTNSNNYLQGGAGLSTHGNSISNSNNNNNSSEDLDKLKNLHKNLKSENEFLKI